MHDHTPPTQTAPEAAGASRPRVLPTSAELDAAARAARKLALPAVSQFAVGAALLCRDGQIFTGANIENLTLALTVCAERTALFGALLAGLRRADFVAISVAGPPSAKNLSPCGPCRQLLMEYAGPELKVRYLWQGAMVEKSLGELLPDSPEVNLG